MVSLPLAILIPLMLFLLGILGLTRDGLPLTPSRRIKGLPGAVAGILFFWAGIGCIWLFFFSSLSRARPGAGAELEQLGNAASQSTVVQGKILTFRDYKANCLVALPTLMLEKPGIPWQGGAATLRVFAGMDERTGITYQLFCVDVPAGADLDLRRQAVNLLATSGFSPEDPASLTFAGRYPAWDVAGTKATARGQDRALCRSILVADRLYLLSVTGPQSVLTGEVARSYLDSFALIKPPPA